MSTVSPALVHMLAAWNESDPDRIRAHLDAAVTPDVVFVDPTHAIQGVEAFVAMIVEFRRKFPSAECLRRSKVDAHHDRARYAWRVVLGPDAHLDGVDAVAFDAASGLVRRVDGFFGELEPA